MRAVLTNLGITNSNARYRQNHFHLYLRPPVMQAIAQQNLTSEFESAAATAPGLSEDVAQSASDLLGLWQATLKGLEAMDYADMPHVATADVTGVAIAWDAPLLVVDTRYERVFRGYCQKVESPVASADSALNQFPILAPVLAHFGYRPNATSAQLDAFLSTVTATVLKLPSHGSVVLADHKNQLWFYEPKAGYVGPDSVSFVVQAKGRKFKVEIRLDVVSMGDESRPAKCAGAVVQTPVIWGYDFGPIRFARKDLPALAVRTASWSPAPTTTTGAWVR